MNKYFYKKNEQKSFTILELLIVISVLTIILVIARPRIQGIINNSKMPQVLSELQTLASGVESYYMFSSTPQAYPPNVADSLNWYLTRSTPQILEKSIYDPLTTLSANYYRYSRSTNGKYYMIASTGYDGVYTTNPYVADDGIVYYLSIDDVCITNGKGCGKDERFRYCSTNSQCPSGTCNFPNGCT